MSEQMVMTRYTIHERLTIRGIDMMTAGHALHEFVVPVTLEQHKMFIESYERMGHRVTFEID